MISHVSSTYMSSLWWRVARCVRAEETEETAMWERVAEARFDEHEARGQRYAFGVQLRVDGRKIIYSLASGRVFIGRTMHSTNTDVYSSELHLLVRKNRPNANKHRPTVNWTQ